MDVQAILPSFFCFAACLLLVLSSTVCGASPQVPLRSAVAGPATGSSASTFAAISPLDRQLDHAAIARALIHDADYAVLSTLSSIGNPDSNPRSSSSSSSRGAGTIDRADGRPDRPKQARGQEPHDAAPFGHALSISDGARGNSTGVVYVFITTISQFRADVLEEPRVALSVSQAGLGGSAECEIDPEWPTCARVSLQAKAELVSGTEAKAAAAAAMFARHPHMAIWPTLAHTWEFWRLDVEQAYVLDTFGGYRKIEADAWFNAEPAKLHAQALVGA